MSNDLSVLNPALSLALRDPLNATWGQDEVDDLLTWSVASLYPKLQRPILPSTATVTLVAGTYYYDLPANVLAVHRVDVLNSSGDDLGPVVGRAWEIVGDIFADPASAQIHVSPFIASTAGTLRLHGFGRYVADSPDGETGLIPDDYVPLVLAMARAEAYRRIGSDREKFKVWLARNQSQNVSVNELLELINEADSEAERLRHRAAPASQRPVPGRQGF